MSPFTVKKIALAATLALGTLALPLGATIGLVAPALAQGGSDAGSFLMTPDMMVQLRAYMTRTTSPVTTMPSNLNTSTGTSIPDSLELRSFPPSMNMTSVRYIRTHDALIIVDPRTRRILQVVR